MVECDCRIVDIVRRDPFNMVDDISHVTTTPLAHAAVYRSAFCDECRPTLPPCFGVVEFFCELSRHVFYAPGEIGDAATGKGIKPVAASKKEEI